MPALPFGLGAGPLSFTPNSLARILRASGAAVSAPKPPCSAVTTTTYFTSGYGASATYHDWSGRPGPFSAVPVLPAIGIGKPRKTDVDVPPGALAARRSPSRMAWRFCDEILILRLARVRNSWITRPD